MKSQTSSQCPLILFVLILIVGAVWVIMSAKPAVSPDLDVLVAQNVETVSNVAEVTHQITAYEALRLLSMSVISDHFNSAKHQGDNPNPSEIKQMLEKGLCNPIRVYDCVDWNHRIKFVCPIAPGVEAGLSMGVDTENGLPLAVTAFPAPSSYWDTLGIAGCTEIGVVVHP